MRLRLVLAFAALAIGAGPGWADAASDAVAKVRSELAREPGSYVGCVPGGCLRPQMHPLSQEHLRTVPVVDVDALCKNDSPCIQVEQDSYEFSKSVWESLDSNDRDVCILTSIDLSGNGKDSTFYRRLEVCVSARLEAKDVIDRYSPHHFQP